MTLIHRSTVTVGAGLVLAPLLDDQLSIAPVNMHLEVGVQGAGLLATITVGGAMLAENTPCGAAAAFPVLPDELFFQDHETWAGSRVRIAILNPTAAGIIHFTYARLAVSRRGS